MALRFVVDTSVIKRLGHPAVRQVVEPLAAAGEVARARITDLEVGYSARNELAWDQLPPWEHSNLSNQPHHTIAAPYRFSVSLLNEASAAAKSLTSSSRPPARNTSLQSCTMTRTSTASQQSLANYASGLCQQVRSTDR